MIFRQGRTLPDEMDDNEEDGRYPDRGLLLPHIWLRHQYNIGNMRGKNGRKLGIREISRIDRGVS